jgi:hypothetical protein
MSDSLNGSSGCARSNASHATNAGGGRKRVRGGAMQPLPSLSPPAPDAMADDQDADAVGEQEGEQDDLYDDVMEAQDAYDEGDEDAAAAASMQLAAGGGGGGVAGSGGGGAAGGAAAPFYPWLGADDLDETCVLRIKSC